jgi:hypothetical protein
VILSLGACRLYGEPTRICNVRGLRRERYGSRSCERGGEPSEDAEVGVEGDPLKPANAERREAVLVLQALDGRVVLRESACAIAGGK